MPTSIDPEPAENEIECARCGAHFYFELTRCPNCGVNLYEPEDDAEEKSTPKKGIFDSIKDGFRRVFNKPYSADEVFGDAFNQAILYNDLLQKVGGDRSTADRLINHESQLSPRATRMTCIKNAIQRLERDNRGVGQS